jgi:lipopolysaccharide transport system permease protein
LLGGTTSVSDRKDLLTKVRFPAQVLPATVVLTNLINFLLSLPLLLGLGFFFGITPTWHVVFALPVLLVQTFFTLAVTYFFAAFNVAFRDLQHIVSNLVQMLFFLTPVLWDIRNVSAMAGMSQAETQRVILTFNPMASVMSAWRDIFVQQTAPDWTGLGTVSVISLVVMIISAAIFERRREEFAELV